jgi:hypothetical protein
MHEATCPRCGQIFQSSDVEVRGSPYRIFNVPKACDSWRISRPVARRPVGLRDGSAEGEAELAGVSLDPQAECAVSAAQRGLDCTLHK